MWVSVQVTTFQQIRLRTIKLIARHGILNTGSIKHLRVSRCGRYEIFRVVIIYVNVPPRPRYLLVNSSDRVIRHFEIPAYPAPTDPNSVPNDEDLEPIYRFADPVDKVSWNAIGYSSDTEWVIGGTYIQFEKVYKCSQ